MKITGGSLSVTVTRFCVLVLNRQRLVAVLILLWRLNPCSAATPENETTSDTSFWSRGTFLPGKWSEVDNSFWALDFPILQPHTSLEGMPSFCTMTRSGVSLQPASTMAEANKTNEVAHEIREKTRQLLINKHTHHQLDRGVYGRRSTCGHWQHSMWIT